MTLVFYMPHTRAVVEARLRHLEELNLPLSGLKTLEIAAGIGNLTGWFLEQGCDIFATEGRPTNAREHRLHYPQCQATVVDLDEPGSHDRFGLFELVVCYGILYHVRNPQQVLEDMSRVCSKLLLLETEVCADNDWGELILGEGNGDDQSLCGFSVRLGRGRIMEILRQSFPFVYLSITQPKHPWYPLHWPASTGRALSLIHI